jgi:flagellar assembly factor FliW
VLDSPRTYESTFLMCIILSCNSCDIICCLTDHADMMDDYTIQFRSPMMLNLQNTLLNTIMMTMIQIKNRARALLKKMNLVTSLMEN